MPCTPLELRAIFLMLLAFQQEESPPLNAHYFYEFVFCLGPKIILSFETLREKCQLASPRLSGTQFDFIRNLGFVFHSDL